LQKEENEVFLLFGFDRNSKTNFKVA